MGFISRSSNGLLKVVYNRGNVTHEDVLVLKYAVSAFSHLVNCNEKIRLVEFRRRIQRVYITEGKTKLCVDALSKAAILQMFLCAFSYMDEAGNLVKKDKIVVEVEEWSDVRRWLEARLNLKILDLEFTGGASVYKKGAFSYQAAASQEVEL